VWSLCDAVLQGTNVVLLLGVSGAIALPFIKLMSGSKIITNIDGFEWKRKKWNFVARQFLRISEFSEILKKSPNMFKMTQH
jgi:hypothetical protein